MRVNKLRQLLLVWRHPRRTGDTIVEVMLAIVIISAAISLGVATSHHNLSVGIDASQRSQAQSLAQGQIERLRNAYTNQTPILSTYKSGQPFCIKSNGDIALVSAHPSECSNYNGSGYDVSITYSGASGVGTIPPETFSVKTTWVSGANGAQEGTLNLAYKLPIAGGAVNNPKLTVTVVGNGTVTIPAGGGQSTQTCTSANNCSNIAYDSNTSLRLTEAPAAGSTFQTWGGSCSSGGQFCDVSMTGDKTVTANFTGVVNSLSVTKAGNGSGTVTSNDGAINCGSTCGHDYGASTPRVNLHPAPAPGSTFDSWGGACTGTAKTSDCTVTVINAVNVTARFGSNPTATLTVNIVDDGYVGIPAVGGQPGHLCDKTTTPCTYTYPTGANPSLTATPGFNKVFRHWSGDCSGTLRPCNPTPLTMSANKSVTATFSDPPIKITPNGMLLCKNNSNPTDLFTSQPITVKVTVPDGFNAPIALSASPLLRMQSDYANDQRNSYNFSPSTFPQPGNGTSTMIIRYSKNTADQANLPYVEVTVSATGGGQTFTATLYLKIRDCNGGGPICLDPNASNYNANNSCSYPTVQVCGSNTGNPGQPPPCQPPPIGGCGTPGNDPCPPPPNCNPGTPGYRGSPPCQCFVAGTLITMADGPPKPIEDVKSGDVIESYDVNSRQTVPGKVSQTFVHFDAQTYVLETTAGTIVTTPNHPFWSGGKWVEAGDLWPGAQLLDEHSKSQMVLNGHKASQATVYNLEVDGTHDYFAGGILVHNKIN